MVDKKRRSLTPVEENNDIGGYIEVQVIVDNNLTTQAELCER